MNKKEFKRIDLRNASGFLSEKEMRATTGGYGGYGGSEGSGGYDDDDDDDTAAGSACVAWCMDGTKYMALLYMPNSYCYHAAKECQKNGWSTLCESSCSP